MKLYEKIAHTVTALKNCKASGNVAWLGKHADTIRNIEKNLLPSGSGFDAGTTIDLDRTNDQRITLTTSFHHMDEHGFYSGWTDHEIVVTPSFIGEIDLKIKGRNQNQIKDYIFDVFYTALIEEFKE